MRKKIFVTIITIVMVISMTIGISSAETRLISSSTIRDILNGAIEGDSSGVQKSIEGSLEDYARRKSGLSQEELNSIEDIARTVADATKTNKNQTTNSTEINTETTKDNNETSTIKPITINNQNVKKIGGTQATETKTEVTEHIEEPTGASIKNGEIISFDKYNGDRTLFCGKHGAPLPGEESTFVDVLNVRLSQVKNGETYSVPEGTQNTKSKTLARYNASERRTAGVDGDWFLAYILSLWKDNESGQSEVQHALWSSIYNEGEKVPMNDIAEEAMAFEEYKERLAADGGFKASYVLDAEKVACDEPTGYYISGPYSIHYQRGFAKVGSRPKVEFGGIQEINLYDQNGNIINQSAWKITYDAEHRDSYKERPEGDADYGTEGLDGFFSYPYTDEEFNIVLDSKAIKGVTSISKIEVIYYDKNYTAEYTIMTGEYNDVDWKVEHDTIRCPGGRTQRSIDGAGNVHEIKIACPHGQMSAHDIPTNFRIVAHTTGVEAQKFYLVLLTTRTTTTTTELPPIPNIPETPNVTPPTPGITWPKTHTRWFPIPIPIDWDDDDDDHPPIPTPEDDDDDDDGIKLTMKIAGIVWEDIQTGKESNYDNVIGTKSDGTTEDGVQNVKVTLYKYGTTELAEAKVNPVYTDEDGAYVFSKVPMGQYDVEFKYDGITYTTVKSFEGGSVEDYKENPNDDKYRINSKAEEVAEDRTNFNAKFYEITGDSSKASTEGKTYGLARDVNGNVTVNLEYANKDGVSKLLTADDKGYTKPEFEFAVKTSSQGIKYPFKERYVNDVNDKKIDNKMYEANYPYMLYVNLGLKKRQTADFAVMKDVSSATVTINKKQLDYKYATKKDKLESGEDVFNIKVKKQENIFYNRSIYTSDYNYRIDDYKENTKNVSSDELKGITSTKTLDDELKIFVTYFMTVRNQSGLPSGTINELVDYYDSTYNVINSDVIIPIQNANGQEENKVVAQQSHYITSTGKTGNITWKSTEKYGNENLYDKYDSMYTTDLENVILQPNEDMYIYVTFEVDKTKDGNRDLMIGTLSNPDLANKNNFVEINSFTVLENGATSKQQVYGQVDMDSAPGNLNPYDEKTKEDDSDSAPTISIHIEKGMERNLNGTVWEDKRSETLSTGQKVGNGLMDDKENRVNGVTVQLIELVDGVDENGNKKQFEYIWQEMSSSEGKYEYVNNQGAVMSGTRGNVEEGTVEAKPGEYLFKNYIPGNYIVRFKYGDTEKTILPENNNGVSYNGQDYKSTAYQQGNNLDKEWYDLSDEKLNSTRMSDAKDNKGRRLDVINYSKVMKNSIAEVLYSTERDFENKNDLLQQLKDNTWMYADTAKIKVEVEKDKTEASGFETFNYDIPNIDFGVEQRPVNNMELSKEIKNIIVTASNGDVLINKEQGLIKNVNWVKNSENSQGKVNIYMDEEVMQGAKIQIDYVITVKNTGEVDSIGEDGVGETYYTGKVSNDRIVTTSYDKIIDYVDNSLVFKAEDNPDWKLIEKTELGNKDNMVANGYLSKSVKFERKTTQNGELVPVPVSQIIVNEKLSTVQLVPEIVNKNQCSDKVELTLTKTISSADDKDDLAYDNMAELVQFTNLVGRKGNIPGNQSPDEKPAESDSDYTETVIIAPPTGANKSQTYLLVVSAILVLIGGTVYFVRRKTIKK